jgi:hypothetical protein
MKKSFLFNLIFLSALDLFFSAEILVLLSSASVRAAGFFHQSFSRARHPTGIGFLLARAVTEFRCPSPSSWLISSSWFLPLPKSVVTEFLVDFFVLVSAAAKSVVFICPPAGLGPVRPLSVLLLVHVFLLRGQ